MQLYDTSEQLEDNEPGAPLLSSDIEIDPSEAIGMDPNEELTFDSFSEANPTRAAWKLLEAFAVESLNWTDDYRRVVKLHSSLLVKMK